MTPAVLDRPGSLAADAPRPEGRRPVTLEERLSAALHEARANGSTECLVCHARMTPVPVPAVGAGAAPAVECGGCGTLLS